MIRAEVFNQIGVDSAALGLLSSSVHRFDRPGRYVGTAFVGDDARGEYEILVDESGPPSAHVDLSSFGRQRRHQADACCEDSPDPTRRAFHVGKGGSVSFYVGSGTQRWGTVIGDPSERSAEFDSRRLQEGDMFAASVLRPGQYSVRNADGDGRTELIVRGVKPGKEPYRPADPIRTKMAATAGRKSMRLGQAQGVIFTASTPMRVVIELDKPFDD